MKTALLPLLCLMAASALVLPQKPQKLDSVSDHILCLLCIDVASDTEKWIGDVGVRRP